MSDGGDSTGGGQMSEGVARLRACVLSLFSHVRLFVTPWTLSRQAPLSTGSSTQECWSGLPFPPPGDLPHPGIEPMSLGSLALAGRFLTTLPPGKSPWKKQFLVNDKAWGSFSHSCPRMLPEVLVEMQILIPLV